MTATKNARHHVVIGSGVAGSQAADTLREREPDARVTILTLSSLLFYNRYDLPKVFRGHRDWREFLAYPAEYYKDHRIEVRRCSRVAGVDGLAGRVRSPRTKEAPLLEPRKAASPSHCHAFDYKAAGRKDCGV
jgi:NADPH-dependent 2,4-dienoyl-CoA reductase/sulfur reductase-like enzyme